MSEVQVSFVIVNYNVKELLRECLASINKYSDHDNTEAIVIDNASSDGSVEMIAAEFPNVQLIANDANTGFPAANNQGFRIARGKYIFMLNPDAALRSDAATALAAFMASHTMAGMVAPQLLNTDQSVQQSVWRLPTLWSVFCDLYHLHFWNGRHNYAGISRDSKFAAESFSGAAMFFEKELLAKIGMLDETMFWIEDVEFCKRIHESGRALYYFPEVKVTHHVGQSARKNYKISLSNQVFNKIKYFKKHKSIVATIIVIKLSLFHCLLKGIYFGVGGIFSAKAARKAAAYWYTLPRTINPPASIT